MGREVEESSAATNPKPTILVPPRASMEFFLTNGSFPGFSPGPITLVSSYFPEQSFSQLLAGAMASPLAAKTGSFPPAGQEDEIEGFPFSELAKSKESGSELERNRPTNLVVALSRPPLESLSSLFMVPPGISPSGLLSSPGFSSPLQSPFGMSHQQALAHVTAQAALSQSLKLQAEAQQPASTDPTVEQPAKVETATAASCDRKAVCAAGDKPASDGYNWRKYGQKHVKASECPRSYYKCTHPDCSVKKKVERAVDGRICEITYKGQHNHDLPQTTKRARDSGSVDGTVLQNQNEANRAKGSLQDAVATQQGFEHGSVPQNRDVEDAAVTIDLEESKPVSKRRSGEIAPSLPASSQQTVTESKIVLQTRSEVDLLDDGYRWRKYGQKVVKGNPNPRSYYRCTFAGCNVRKHVERSSADPKSVITTYEGKHSHDLPSGRSSHYSAAKTKLVQQNNVTSQASPVKESGYGDDGQKPVTLHLKDDQVIA